MTPLTAPLPANKTHQHRASLLMWAGPSRRLGVLEVQEQEAADSPVRPSRYAVSLLAGGSVLEYRVTKPRGEEFYRVTIVPDAPAEDSCECWGFLRHRHCKHAEALRAHHDAGHLG